MGTAALSGQSRSDGAAREAGPRARDGGAGRADQGCDHYIGKIIQKALNSNQRIRLNKDQVVKINILIKEDANLPYSETVTYLKDPE